MTQMINVVARVEFYFIQSNFDFWFCDLKVMQDEEIFVILMISLMLSSLLYLYCLSCLELNPGEYLRIGDQGPIL